MRGGWQRSAPVPAAWRVWAHRGSESGPGVAQTPPPPENPPCSPACGGRTDVREEHAVERGLSGAGRGRESAGCQSAGHVPHARLRGLVEAVTAAGRPGMRRERERMREGRSVRGSTQRDRGSGRSNSGEEKRAKCGEKKGAPGQGEQNSEHKQKWGHKSQALQTQSGKEQKVAGGRGRDRDSRRGWDDSGERNSGARSDGGASESGGGGVTGKRD